MKKKNVGNTSSIYCFITYYSPAVERKRSNAGSSNAASPSTSSESPATKNYSIGISRIAPHPSLDATKEGFLAALKDAGIVEGENLKVDYSNAQGESSNNLAIAQKFRVQKMYDLVLGIATPSALALADNVKD